MGAERREDVDQFGRPGRQLSFLLLDQRREAASTGSQRHVVFYCRAHHERVLLWNNSRQARHSRRQHRIFFVTRRARAAGEHDWRRRRRLQDRDVCARAGSLHRRGGSDGRNSRGARRFSCLRQHARDVWHTHREPSTGKAKDCGYGSRLPDEPLAMVVCRLLEERGQAKRESNQPRKVASHHQEREGRIDGHRGTRG